MQTSYVGYWLLLLYVSTFFCKSGPPPDPAPAPACVPERDRCGNVKNGCPDPEDSPATDSDPSWGCATCRMPRWQVAEPTITLFLHDNPFSYQPSRGPEIGFDIVFKNTPGTDVGEEAACTNIFSFGTNWHSPWRSYIRVCSGTSNHVYLGDGARITNRLNKVEYNSQVLLKYDSTNDKYRLASRNGATNVYAYPFTDLAGTVRYFLTEMISVEGHVTTFEYIVTNNVCRLTKVIDVDGQETTFQYTNTCNYHAVSQVTAPYGRFASFFYDGAARLTNITDTLSLSSKMFYAADGTLTNLVTPYGSTAFSHFSGADYAAVKVNELGTRKHFYLWLDEETAGKIPTTLISKVPSTTNGNYSLENLFDVTNSNKRNSFFWGARQYESLAALVRTNLDNESFTLSNLSSDDYKLARMRHWLKMPWVTEAGSTLSLECAPSPDGVQQGHITWYDYANKNNDKREQEGVAPFPCFTASKLPNGQDSFKCFERNDWCYVTNEIQTYVNENKVRTNKFRYEGNDIDMWKVVNAANEKETNVFNNFHQVITNYNFPNEVTTYIYDGSNRLVSTTLPSGLITTNIYGADGRLSTTIEKDATQSFRTNSYTWTNGHIHTHTDPRGLTITNTWDAGGRLTLMAYPDGTFVTNTYSNFDLVQVVDRMGFTNRIEYNGFREKIREINPRGFTNSYSYCACGSLDSMTDPLGNTTTYTYDLAGRRTRTTNPDGSYIDHNYNLYGQLTNETDSAGMSITNTYNNQGLLITSSNSFGQILKAVFDEEDNLTNHTDANGTVITEALDALGRLLARIHADGGVENFEYSARGQIKYIDQLGKNTWYALDALGRKTAETNANLELVQFGYSPADDLLSLSDARNNTTSWKYDEYGRVTNKTDAAGTVILASKYDANGRLTNRWSAAKGNTFYTYDAAGNLTLVDYPTSPDIALQYDANNRLTNMVDASGTTRYSYTSAGLLQSEDGPWEMDTVTYAYTNGMRSRLALQQPNASAWIQTYAYDAVRRLQSLTSPAGVFSYNYLCGGLLVTNLSLPNGAKITNSYNNVAHLTATVLRNSANALLNSHTYKYPQIEWCTNTVRTDGNYLNYAYDFIGQLTNVNAYEAGGTGRSIDDRDYGYDPSGNLTNRSEPLTHFRANALNQLTNTSRSSLMRIGGYTTCLATNVTVSGYSTALNADKTFETAASLSLVDGTNTFTAIAQDSYGRSDTNTVSLYLPASVNFGYDNNGNLLSDGLRGFEYDDENQLVRITLTNAWKTEFSYDGQKRRRIRQEFIWQNGSWALSNEVRYVYDGNLVLQERDCLNLPTVAFTRGADVSGTLGGAGGIAGLLARTDGRSLAAPHMYFHGDGNGNVTMLISTQQLSAAKYLYEAYGNLILMAGPLAEDNLYRFSSKEYHPASGSVYYLYRYYEPNLQRWVNRDPIEEQGGINLYRFAKNNSINYADLHGLFTTASPGDPILDHDEYGSVLVFRVWCPAGTRVAEITPNDVDFNDKEMYHDVADWYKRRRARETGQHYTEINRGDVRGWMKAFRRNIGADKLGEDAFGYLDKVGRRNCNGNPVPVVVSMRRRLVSPRTSARLGRAALAVPDAESMIRIYQNNTQIHYECEACPGSGCRGL